MAEPGKLEIYSLSKLYTLAGQASPRVLVPRTYLTVGERAMA